MNDITLNGKRFRKYIDEDRIEAAVRGLAMRMNNDLSGSDDVVFIGILNGSFLFAADLFRHINLNARISFLKLASYEGTSSSGSIRDLIGWNEDVQGKCVVVVEDIVDTGNTLELVIGGLKVRKARDIRVATLLFKPGAYTKDIKPDYVGFEIPNDFVVGYGLDYDGYGRNLPAIYTLID
ncbi:MAG: hypoxanthine phosphoribosyltransferase [Bacteroidales bacterium]|nr:hypoxanthine phosphoribosyltransferase [Bacteroidales bacterium]